jgi:methylglyoxal reductase
LVIAWTAAQPGATHILCGARDPKHAIENAVAGNTTLTAEALATMDQAMAKHANNIE